YDLSALLMLEVGKTWDEADGEVAESIDLLLWYADQMLGLEDARQLTPVEGERTAFVYVPLGAGVVVSPWNFPLALTMGMLSAALVAGNPATVKPSSNSPTTVAWLVRLLFDAGLPRDVVSYLTGSGSTLGLPLVEDPRVRWVAFTGSREVGIEIHEHAARVSPGQRWL